MRAKKYPILDHDPNPKAILEPGEIINKNDLSNKAVLCFFQDVIADLVSQKKAYKVDRLRSEMGDNPIYQVVEPSGSVLLIHPGVGAPLAGAFLEELIAKGCNQFVACGGCGVLEPAFQVGHILLPVEALRDEGTSYAYVPPGERVFPDPTLLLAIKSILQQEKIPYDQVITWTTDAIYRETASRARLRRKQGCKVVEMETAAFYAIAKFRKVQFAQILYGGDAVHESGWDNRDWMKRENIRKLLFELSVQALLSV